MWKILEKPRGTKETASNIKEARMSMGKMVRRDLASEWRVKRWEGRVKARKDGEA